MTNKALGRGLSSLLKEKTLLIQTSEFTNEIDINLIIPNKTQPRKLFKNDKINELAESITNHGVLQPIIVKKDADKYLIIAGERRYRASKIVGLTSIPAIIKEYSEKEILEIALIENIQRDELTSIEEAEGYLRLVEEHGYTQSELSSIIGKSRSHIANLLRLNQLPKSIKEMVNNGAISMGHARCLIGIKNSEEIMSQIIKNKLSVRKTEILVTEKKNNKKEKVEKISTAKQQPFNTYYDEQNEDLIMLSESLSEKMGLQVIVENKDNGGRISIHYSDLEELDSILTKIN